MTSKADSGAERLSSIARSTPAALPARPGRFGPALGLLLVILGPLLALATLLVVNVFEEGPTSPYLRGILLADLVYVLVVAALVIRRLMRLMAARRVRSAGARLQARLTLAFTLIALVPTVLVAVFATLTINFGLESWFSDRVQQVLAAALRGAETYEKEHARDLEADAKALAAFLERLKRERGFLTDAELREAFAAAQKQIQRGLKEAYIIDRAGTIRARGERSYLFDYERPAAADFDRADRTGLALIRDWPNDEFRALLPLEGYLDRYLYVTRRVDGNLLGLLDETRDTVRFYQQLERDRGRLLFEFALIYLSFAVLLVMAAVWLGLWFAERLARPVGRLAEAAERVGQGDLTVRVPQEGGDDEIAMLGEVFNQMTRRIKAQHDALVAANRLTEERRRLFDSVLSGVSTGVVGVDAEGRIAFVNPAAARLLALDPDADQGRQVEAAIPELAPLWQRVRQAPLQELREELALERGGRREQLLVRITARRGADGAVAGHVVTFDDVTDLVAAQRMAAWGDVARRIAHEIKNPLTPIQLSVETLRRKFRPLAGEEADALEQYTSVIIRQTEDLRRIVDEFSRFARMPRPQPRPADLVRIVKDALLLQKNAMPDVAICSELPAAPVMALVDPGMMTQAVTNLIKNAGEAITARHGRDPDAPQGEIRIGIEKGAEGIEITIADNGIGLPEDRGALFEPYVTTREKGTGLGLAIVRKIVEEHGGTLALEDAPPFTEDGHRGALVRIRLPRAVLLDPGDVAAPGQDGAATGRGDDRAGEKGA